MLLPCPLSGFGGFLLKALNNHEINNRRGLPPHHRGGGPDQEHYALSRTPQGQVDGARLLCYGVGMGKTNKIGQLDGEKYIATMVQAREGRG